MIVESVSPTQLILPKKSQAQMILLTAEIGTVIYNTTDDRLYYAHSAVATSDSWTIIGSSA